MAINLKTEEGMEFSFDTVEELMDFKRQLDADEASKESEDEIEVPENESKLEVGDKVRIVSSEDGTGWPYHYHDVGSVGKVVSKQAFGRIEVEVGGETQYLLPRHYVKLETQGDAKNNEPSHSSAKFGTGDIVKVTESFVDIFGDRVSCGAVYNYDENLLYGEPFVGTVFLGDNKDKIELVCRADDRLDI